MNNTPEERLRTVAQILIAEIGADCPMDAEDAAEKAVQIIRSLRDRKEGLLAEIEAWKDASQLETAGDPDGILPRRDPRTDPKEGDVLYQANGTRELHVDKVDGDEVVYRVTDGNGGLLAAYRTLMVNWRESAPYTCDDSEMFCPSCGGCGDELVPGGLFGKDGYGYVACRMCGGKGRLYLRHGREPIAD